MWYISVIRFIANIRISDLKTSNFLLAIVSFSAISIGNTPLQLNNIDLFVHPSFMQGNLIIYDFLLKRSLFT